MGILAIIPARSGSRGLKNKNIKELLGMPMMAYSIRAALESKIFDTVMVSTDSEEYASIAKKYGAEVPFLRSEYASSNTASTRDCIIEVLKKYEEKGIKYDRFMILQPTSPLRKEAHIKEAFKLFEEKNAKSVISVCEMEHSPLWSNILKSDLCMKNFIYRSKDDIRQNLDIYYRINGAIYLHDVKYYLEHEYFYDDTSFAYIMPKINSVDIDDEFDFNIAEIFLSKEGLQA